MSSSILTTYKRALFGIVTGEILTNSFEPFVQIYRQLLQGSGVDIKSVNEKDIIEFYHHLSSLPKDDYESVFFKQHFSNKIFQLLISEPNNFTLVENNLMKLFYKRGLNSVQKDLLDRWPQFDGFLFHLCAIRMKGKMQRFVEMYSGLPHDVISHQMDESEQIGLKLKSFILEKLIDEKSILKIRDKLEYPEKQIMFNEKENDLYQDYVLHFQKFDQPQIKKGIIFGLGLFTGLSCIQVKT